MTDLVENIAEDEPQMNRIERRKLAFRDKITDAALRLFHENGIAETNLASIIKEADIAHKTFFNHFPTKDHLLLHIASTFSDNAYNLLRKGIEDKTDPKYKIEFCLGNIAKALVKVSPHYKELLNFYLISGAGDSDLRAKQKVEFSSIINHIITEAKANNQLRTGYTEETFTDIIVGICVSTLLNWSLEDDFPIMEKMNNAIRFINETVFINSK